MSWLDRPASETQITHRDRLWLYGVTVLVLAFLVLPTLIVIPMSFSASRYLEFPPRQWSLRWYEAYFASATWMDATRTSLTAASLTALTATPLGTAAAYGLYFSRLRLGKLAFWLMMTPIIVPAILVGIAIFYAYVQLKLVNSLIGVVLAHTVVAIPIVMMIVTAALQSFDVNQERVARSLGASRLRAFVEIVAPQIRFSLVTAAIFAFLTSFDEVIIAIFVSGGSNSTLTRTMFASLRDQIDPTIAAISTMMIVVTTGLVLAVHAWGARRR